MRPDTRHFNVNCPLLKQATGASPGKLPILIELGYPQGSAARDVSRPCRSGGFFGVGGSGRLSRRRGCSPFMLALTTVPGFPCVCAFCFFPLSLFFPPSPSIQLSIHPKFALRRKATDYPKGRNYLSNRHGQLCPSALVDKPSDHNRYPTWLAHKKNEKQNDTIFNAADLGHI